MKLCTRFERNRTISGGVIAISVFDLMTLNIAWHDALGSGIIFSKVDIRQLICSWTIALSDADTLCHAVTLTFDLLILKVRGISSATWLKAVQNLSEIEHSPAKLLIIFRIFAHVMSRCDPKPLTSGPWTYRAFGVSCVWSPYKIWANPIIRGWVINDLARFRVQSRGGAQTELSLGCADQIGQDIGRSSVACNFV